MDQQSSLDRFLKNRAAAILGMDMGKTMAMRPLIGGSLLALGGLAMLITGLFQRDPGVAGGSIGLFMGGGAAVAASLWHRRHWYQQPTTEAEINKESRDLMMELTRKVVGWNSIFDNAGWRFRRRRMRLLLAMRYGSHESKLEDSARNLLNTQAFDLLESACFHYNRIFGVLEGSDDPGVQKMARPVKLAADETLFALFEDASVVQKYPEGGVPATASAKIASLKELADRMEGLQKSPLGSRTEGVAKIDSVLEELKLEQLARTELQTPTEEEEHLEQR